MKCPHQLEPHQIQGMDFIHIFPVVQWLVKRAIETKEEMGDYIRSYSISQFQKTYSLPEDDDFIKRKDKAIQTVVDLSDAYKPRRKYRRQQGAEELLDEESRVHSTLLEYGRRHGFSRQSKTEKAEDKKTALAAGLSAAEKTDAHEEDELQAAEEQRIQSLMTKMTAMANEESRLSASSVGQIVGLCSAEIQQIVSEYAGKVRYCLPEPELGSHIQLYPHIPAASPVVTETSWNSPGTFVRSTGTRLAHAQPSTLAHELN